jgi:two-component system, OmpR family, sensor histidine kinase CiaH
MFQSARLKLTIWYLTIIMLVSAIFSMVIYGNVSHQIEGLIRMQNDRLRNFQNFPPPGFNPPPMIGIDELKGQEEQLLYTLLFVNAGILVFAGGLGYLLAGKNLHPIKLMIDEQNQFISDASHELRTPIATLQAEMEGRLLEKNITDSQARQLIKSNLEELGTLKNMTNSMLQLTRAHAMDSNSQMQSFSLLELINLAKDKISVLALKKHISIHIKMPEMIISGNREDLLEVFLILIENAIKYSPNNSDVEISCKKLPDKVNIFVVDHGIGISDEDLPRIFERFYRADKSRSVIEGFGLGLSIAKKIIEGHKGSISVTSKVGKGSTFEVSLPVSGKIKLINTGKT